MKTKIYPLLSAGLGLGCAVLGLLAGGCSLPQVQPDLARYFVLTGQPLRLADSAPAGSATSRIGLRAVEVPAFLRTKSMVVRVNRNEVRLVEDARWAEPLEAGIARALRENLDAHPGVSRVVLVTATSDQPRDFDVVIRVLRCEGGRDGDVARFAARIEILAPNTTNERRASDVFSTEVAGWNGNDYGQLAQKLSEAIAELADRVVKLADASQPK